MHRQTDTERRLRRLAQDLYGNNVDPFSQINHARYHCPNTLYHVVSKVFQGRFLLRPELRFRLRGLVLGVIGRAMHVYPDVKVFAKAFMSNHMHLMLQAPPEQFSRFVGFIKREISRRWGSIINWPGAMWEPYYSTALPSAESQLACYKYILSHGVKEGLVDKPQKWPGVHSARALAKGVTPKGRWLNATAYGVARNKEKVKRHPRPVNRRDYITEYSVKLSRLPQWEHLSPEQHQVKIQELLDTIVEEGRKKRRGRRPLGVQRIVSQSRHKRAEIPKPPWFTQRRRMVVWGGLHSPEARDYAERYWAFQIAFRQASDRLRSGELQVEFPIGAFRPGWQETTGASNVTVHPHFVGGPSRVRRSRA